MVIFVLSREKKPTEQQKKGNHIFLSIYKIIPIPFCKSELLLSHTVLHLTCPFFPKGMPENIKKNKQQKPNKKPHHKTNVPMCFALIQPRRKELVCTPTGIDRKKKKKTSRETGAVA